MMKPDGKWRQMRDTFIDTLFKKAAKNSNIIFISNEYGAPSLDRFRKDLPGQFINAGISEQNIISLAAGMALEGKQVFVYSIASFITLRCLEQIKLDICAHRLPVAIIGVGTCYAYSEDGPSHHATEDISVMRALSGMHILSPSDLYLCQKIAEWSCTIEAPCYIRLDRNAEDYFGNGDTGCLDAGLRVFGKGNDVLLICTGAMTKKGLEIMEQLRQKGIGVSVLDLFRLKPVSSEILEYLKKYPYIITIEEHTLNGGLGSILAEMILDHGLKTRLKRIGITDELLYAYGVRESLHRQNRMDDETLLVRILNFLET